MEWELIALVVVTILMLCAGGYIKRLVGDVKHLVDAISDAIEDGQVNDQEIALIIKRARVLGESLREVTNQILRLRR